MTQSTVVPRYVRALVDAAEERGVLEQVQEDVQGLQGLLLQSEDLQAFLADPLAHPQQKQQTFRALFSGKVNELTLNFLMLLCEKRRERVLDGILQGFLDLLDERRGVATAQVRAAKPLAPEQQERLARRLSERSGKQVQLQVEVDPGLKVGFVARLGDQVFDGTLEAQLNRLRERLTVGL